MLNYNLLIFIFCFFLIDTGFAFSHEDMREIEALKRIFRM